MSVKIGERVGAFLSEEENKKNEETLKKNKIN